MRRILQNYHDHLTQQSPGYKFWHEKQYAHGTHAGILVAYLLMMLKVGVGLLITLTTLQSALAASTVWTSQSDWSTWTKSNTTETNLAGSLTLSPTGSSSSWQNVTTPTANRLRGVWAASSTDAWAVGDSGTIVHYNGSAWSTVASGTAQTLRAIWGSSSSDIWAVGGTNFNSSDGDHIVLHYNGSAWSTVSDPAVNPLSAIWGSSANNVIAIGCQVCGTGAPATAIKWNGSSWSTISDTTLNYNLALSGTSSTDMWAVGNAFTPAVSHWNGSTWTRTFVSGPDTDFNGVFAVAANDVWAVAGEGANPVAYHYNGSTWSEVTMAALLGAARSVWGTSASNIWSVGHNGTIAHYNGSNWDEIIASPTSTTLNSVWGADSSHVWAVGDSGKIIQYASVPSSYQSSGTATKILTPTVGKTQDWQSAAVNKTTNSQTATVQYTTNTNCSTGLTTDITTLADSESICVKVSLSTSNAAVSPSVEDITLTYAEVTSGGSSGGGTSGGGGGETGGTTPNPTPTPTVIQVTACSGSIKNLTVTTNHVTADFTFTTTTATKGILYYYASSHTRPVDAANTKATNYDLGTIKVQEDTATKDHKITLQNLVPSTKYYYTLTLSNGTVECEHNFTTQAPPPTPTPTPNPTPTPSTKPGVVTSTISGYVYEQGTTTPIPNVSIFMYKRWLFGWRHIAKSTTDANGYWQIKYEKGIDYRVGSYLMSNPTDKNAPRSTLEFAKPGEACPASEVNTRFISWYGDKRLTDTPCENNIFYASFIAQVGGTVLEAGNQNPAPGVTVGLRRKEFFGLFWRTTAFTATDKEGKWQFAYMTGYEYQVYVNVQDSSAIFPQGSKLANGTVILAQYKANGKPATLGCTANKYDDRTINWDASVKLTSDGCSNNTFYVTKRSEFSVQTLVDKANAPLANVQLRLLGYHSSRWRGSQDYKKTDQNGIVTYAYFPGATFRVYTFNSVPGYVQGYTLAFPGCPAKTVQTTSRINLVEWADDKQLPDGGCSNPTRMYMTSTDNVNLGVAINPPGGTFKDKVEVTLSHTPENHIGSLRLGSAPVLTSSAAYRKPFLITKSRKVYAKFFGSESPEVTADFVITKATPTPTPNPTPSTSPSPGPTPTPSASPTPEVSGLTVSATPAGGEFDEPTTISLAASDSTAKIMYTADGSDPTTGGQEYSAPFTVTSSTLLHFYAQKDSTQSEMGEEEYTFKDSENPVIIDWEDDTPDPPPYIILCNDVPIGTATSTTFTDTNLHYDGCVYKITSGDTEITPSNISFADLIKSTQSAALALGKIAAALAALLAVIPLAQTLARLPELLRYAWVHLFLLFRFRKKDRVWAKTESAVTQKGIFGASIAFVDINHYNRVIERTFSDLNGNFVLTNKTGKYVLSVNHPNYSFPSRVTPKGYHGESIHITEQGAPEIVIPMDDSNGGSLWVQWLKAAAFRLASFNTLVIILGLALTLYCVIWGMPDLSTPVLWFNGVLAVYYVLFLIQEMRKWRSGRKTVVVRFNGKPTPLAIVRLLNAQGETIATQATDGFGRALIVARKGSYTLTAMVPTQKGAQSHEQPIHINRNPLTQKTIIDIT